MRAIAPSSFLAIVTLVGCTGARVTYSGEHRPHLGYEQVHVYHLECPPGAPTVDQCTSDGARIGATRGVFRVNGNRARRDWPRYREYIIERAAAEGCPAVALPDFAPSGPDGVGGFCVDAPAPAIAPGSNVAPAGTVPTSEGAPPPTTGGAAQPCMGAQDCPLGSRCNQGFCQRQ